MNTMSHETIPHMLDIMEMHNNGENVQEKLSYLLDHSDYQKELNRYANHPMREGFTKEDFIEFFINIRTLETSDIKSLDLKTRQSELIDIMDNLEFYKNFYLTLKHANINELEKAIVVAKNGLPDSIEISGLHVMFVVGLGMSGGYIYENNIMGDIRLLAISDGLDMTGLLAHESHHFGLFQIMCGPDHKSEDICLSNKLMQHFFGEGTAVKYCNNFYGKLTSKLYPDKSCDVVKQSYDYYIENFDNIYKQLRLDLKMLKDEKSEEVFGEMFSKNYFYTDVEVDGVMQSQYLAQPICYFIGADIWGLIHDEFGKDKVFELFSNPTDVFVYFNQALKNIGREDLVIEI